MKVAGMLVVCASISAIPQAVAQKWEFGAAAGEGFYSSRDVTAPGGSASAKIQSNGFGSIWVGENGLGRWGGELHYDYQRGDLELSRGSTQAAFGGRSQAIHYDFVFHLTGTESTIRPFIAAGGGIKVYQGTGTEVVYQPLSNFALLTNAQDLTGLLSTGAGVKVKVASHLQLRFEVHDYLTPFPKQVIAPAANAKTGGWLQDIVPAVGLAVVF